MVELPWAADCCPCVEKLRTVLPFTAGIRDGAVHLVSTLCPRWGGAGPDWPRIPEADGCTCAADGGLPVHAQHGGPPRGGVPFARSGDWRAEEGTRAGGSDWHSRGNNNNNNNNNTNNPGPPTGAHSRGPHHSMEHHHPQPTTHAPLGMIPGRRIPFGGGRGDDYARHHPRDDAPHAYPNYNSGPHYPMDGPGPFPMNVRPLSPLPVCVCELSFGGNINECA